MNKIRRYYTAGSWLSFIGAIVAYFLTLDSSASWWDCPEYILNAANLEVGHPPGNPTWVLCYNIASSVARIIGGAPAIAPALNFLSALFTALSILFLFQTCFFILRYVMQKRPEGAPLPVFIASLGASLTLAWSDSVWFSAVETEVYAMSLFFTAASIRVMIAWARKRDPLKASPYLILASYLIGLSIGVHELNLLAIPAMMLIFIYRITPGKCTLKGWLSLLTGIVILACILLGMYPGSVTIAGEIELIAVNTLGMSFNSGSIIYLLLLLVAAIAAPVCAFMKDGGGTLPAAVKTLLFFALIWLGGFFLFSRHFLLSLFLSATVALLLAHRSRKYPARVAVMLWMAGFCLLGYSTYLIVPVRSSANPPINENSPSDPFTLLSYLKRDQYGSKPLVWGPTPYAKPMMRETIDSTGKAFYNDIVRKKLRPAYTRAIPGARIANRSGMLTVSDTSSNNASLKRAAEGKDAYILSDYRYDIVYTPELHMLFPRLTSRGARDISNYESWVGMTKENMVEVETSYAIDSLGNPVGKLDIDGKRVKEKSYRPTYTMNLQELFGYQIGYMYFRYLLWNFLGRQNDYNASGEVEHGNFVTGIDPVDSLVLGDQSLLPAELKSENKGRNLYFGIPLLIGILGAVVLCRRGRRGKRANAVILTLFLMTGVAIVVYLNQDPGEPRERDYSFLGSFYAFAIWIAFGISGLFSLAMRAARRSSRKREIATAATAVVALGMSAWMLAVNYDDHDRSGRYGPTDYATNILESLEPDAILFVDGDNYTFPTWYVQEVLGVRPDVTVVNLAYLSSPWYVEQLMIPREGSRPLPLTATPEQIRYEAFSYVRFNNSGKAQEDSTRSVDALSEIRRIYSESNPHPKFSSDMLRLPGLNGSDSVYVDLRSALNGSRAYSLRELTIYDILASNTLDRNPRPIYWQSQLSFKSFAGLSDHLSRALYTLRYTPWINKRKNPEDSSVYLLDEAMRFLPKLRFGGADRLGVYMDPYCGTLISHQRTALIRLARRLMDKGRAAEALKVANTVYEKFPREAWPYQGSVVADGEVWQEGLALADVMEEAAKAVGNRKGVERAVALRDMEWKRLESWKKWYESLAPWQQEAVSPESKRIIRAL